MTARVLALYLVFASLATAAHAGGASPTAADGPREGGTVIASGAYRFEVVFSDQGIRLLASDAAGKPATLAKASAEVRLETRKGASTVHPMLPAPAMEGKGAALALTRDFAGNPDGSLRAGFVVKVLAAEDLRFAAVLRRAGRPVASASLQALIAAYPLQTCVVSGEKLGEHGPAVDHMHEGQLVRFCCAACKKPFAKDPARYLEMIRRGAKDAHPAGSDHSGHSH